MKTEKTLKMLKMLHTLQAQAKRAQKLQGMDKKAKPGAAKPKKKDIDPQAEAELREAFELFDQERKQYFDANDLDRVMRSLHEHLTEDQIKDMILEVDCQGDYRINRDEFLDMMCNF